MSGLWPLLILIAVRQERAASISGVVRDRETGNPLAGAVILVDGLGQTTSSRADGRYRIAAVPAGTWSMTVRAINHQPTTLRVLVPGSGGLQLDVVLASFPRQLSPLEVRVASSRVGQNRSSRSEFAARSISLDSPRLNALVEEVDAFRILGGGDVVIQPEAASGLHVRGGAADQNTFLIDGIPILNPYHTTGMFSSLNPDLLAGVALDPTGSLATAHEALSATISATTRAPTTSVSVRGGVSTTQARISISGPAGGRGAGFLVGFRQGLAGVLAPSADPSYLQPDSRDWLAKFEMPLFGGHAQLLGSGASDEVRPAAGVPGEGQAPPDRTNALGWQSRTLGLTWRTGGFGGQLAAVAWSATSAASVDWLDAGAQSRMRSDRRDGGLQVAFEGGAIGRRTHLGLRVASMRTRYTAESDQRPQSAARQGGGWAPSLFGSRQISLGTGRVEVGGDLTLGGLGVRLGPRASLTWPVGAFGFVAAVARTHQLAQSVRDEESVVSTVFPAQLFVTGPVAASDLASLSVTAAVAPGVRLEAQGYAREFRNVVLPSVEADAPFAIGPVKMGSGSARGLSVTVLAHRTGVDVDLRYGYQRVRIGTDAVRFVPGYGATQQVDGGIAVRPSASTTLRLGLQAVMGRRVTGNAGLLNWEACNLIDRGCEFAGAPHHRGEVLGGTSLPTYARLDLGVQHRFTVHRFGRPTTMVLFGTIGNLLGRTNLLNLTRLPNGSFAPVTMQPMGPIVIGLNWGF